MSTLPASLTIYNSQFIRLLLTHNEISGICTDPPPPKKRNQERNLRTFLIAFKITPNLASKGLQITMEVQDTLYLCLNLYEHSISLPKATAKLNTDCKWESVELRMKTTQYISCYIGLLLLHYYYYYRIPITTLISEMLY